MKKQMLPANKILLKVFIFLAILIVFSNVCTITVKIDCGGYYPGAGENNYPEYIYYVWPGPNGIFAQFCYTQSLEDDYPVYRGVGVTLFRRFIDTQFSDDTSPLEPRVSLYIDGILLPMDTLRSAVSGDIQDERNLSYNPPISELYWMSWTPEMNRGNHEARLEVIRDTGEILEYTWEFTIVR